MCSLAAGIFVVLLLITLGLDCTDKQFENGNISFRLNLLYCSFICHFVSFGFQFSLDLEKAKTLRFSEVICSKYFETIEWYSVGYVVTYMIL